MVDDLSDGEGDEEAGEVARKRLEAKEEKERHKEIMRRMREGYGGRDRGIASGVGGARGMHRFDVLVGADNRDEAKQLGLLNDDELDSDNEGEEKTDKKDDDEEEDEAALLDKMLKERFLQKQNDDFLEENFSDDEEEEDEEDGSGEMNCVYFVISLFCLFSNIHSNQMSFILHQAKTKMVMTMKTKNKIVLRNGLPKELE